MGAVLAFVVIAYNGMKMLNATGDPYSLSQAKSKIFNSLLGLAVLLTSYLILTTINPDLVIIKDVSLSGIQTTITTILNPSTTTKGTKGFEEIPIGTVTENILAGNSSTKNKLECYEYDSEGKIKDNNGDGKIDSKDIVLDRDIFYCMKNLDTALRNMTENKLAKLIKELEGLMKSCSCTRVHTSSIPPLPWARTYPLGGECRCEGCVSYCSACGFPRIGCPNAPGNSDGWDPELKQYFYDPCPNRQRIDCKKEEIKQLLDGDKPEDICYSKGWISDSDPKYPGILTFKDGIKRMTAFKDYFTNQVVALKQAEANSKIPFGERLTLSEFYTIQNQNQENVISKIPYGDYDTSRYCSEFNCSGSSACTLNDEFRMCKKNGAKEYSYDGDPATFYFNSYYNEEQKNSIESVINKDNNKCSVFEQNNGGVIPIGEVVDGTERYGDEVAKRTGDLVDIIQGVYSTAISIYDIPDGCSSNNCTISNTNCCEHPGCCKSSGCCCPSWTIDPCHKAVPKALSYSNYEDYSSEPSKSKVQPYSGCVGVCGEDSRTEPDPEEEYWVCDYKSLYALAKQIYQIKTEVESSCFDSTEDKVEKAIREKDLSRAGYLQKWQDKEIRLFEISGVDSLKAIAELNLDSAKNVISGTPEYLIEPYKLYGCDGELSIVETFEDRFSLLNKLSISRQKMNTCITGYGASYKQNLSQTEVFNCLEGIRHQTLDKLVIVEGFPYPDKSKEKDPYQNCYPYNSNLLTKAQKTKCFNNIERADTDNPDNLGCQVEVKDYMDNYYCCK